MRSPAYRSREMAAIASEESEMYSFHEEEEEETSIGGLSRGEIAINNFHSDVGFITNRSSAGSEPIESGEKERTSIVDNHFSRATSGRSNLSTIVSKRTMFPSPIEPGKTIPTRTKVLEKSNVRNIRNISQDDNSEGDYNKKHIDANSSNIKMINHDMGDMNTNNNNGDEEDNDLKQALELSRQSKEDPKTDSSKTSTSYPKKEASNVRKKQAFQKNIFPNITDCPASIMVPEDISKDDELKRESEILAYDEENSQRSFSTPKDTNINIKATSTPYHTEESSNIRRKDAFQKDISPTIQDSPISIMVPENISKYTELKRESETLAHDEEISQKGFSTQKDTNTNSKTTNRCTVGPKSSHQNNTEDNSKDDELKRELEILAYDEENTQESFSTQKDTITNSKATNRCPAGPKSSYQNNIEDNSKYAELKRELEILAHYEENSQGSFSTQQDTNTNSKATNRCAVGPKSSHQNNTEENSKYAGLKRELEILAHDEENTQESFRTQKDTSTNSKVTNRCTVGPKSSPKNDIKTLLPQEMENSRHSIQKNQERLFQQSQCGTKRLEDENELKLALLVSEHHGKQESLNRRKKRNDAEEKELQWALKISDQHCKDDRKEESANKKEDDELKRAVELSQRSYKQRSFERRKSSTNEEEEQLKMALSLSAFHEGEQRKQILDEERQLEEILRLSMNIQ